MWDTGLWRLAMVPLMVGVGYWSVAYIAVVLQLVGMGYWSVASSHGSPVGWCGILVCGVYSHGSPVPWWAECPSQILISLLQFAS